jgi:two-component system sensor histidine kinase MtrB
MTGLSLRSLFAASTIILTVVALVAATSLMLLTSLLRRTTADVAAGVESVRLAEEAEIDLLLAERAGDSIVQRDVTSRLRRRVAELERHITTQEERSVHARARASTDAYVAALLKGDDERHRLHADAYDRLEALVAVNVDHARQATERAARWDSVANAVSLAAAGLVLLVSVTLVIWLRARAFRPAYDLAHAMRRFGQGSVDVRATPAGGTEFREMSLRFNEMADALAARQRAQVAFLGGVAHDLRGPLSAISLSAATLSTGAHPDPARLRAIVGRIQRGTTLLERMIADFLDVAHLEAGELSLRLEPHDVADIARDVVGLFRERTARHRLLLDVRERALVLCDATRVEQVLTNLVSNAIKYSPEGGDVVVTIAVERGPRSRAVISVRDSGIGISHDDQAQLFEPFRRVGLSRKTIPDVGLGLYVVRNVVRAHGGEIHVESTLGEGAVFSVSLPAFQTDRPEKARVIDGHATN